MKYENQNTPHPKETPERSQGKCNVKSMEVMCPECGHSFQPADAYSKWIQLEADKEIQKAKEKLLEREATFLEKEKALRAEKEEFQAKLDSQVKSQLRQIQESAIQKANEKVLLEMRDLEERLAEKAKALDESHDRQLELRKQIREVQEKEKQLALEVENRVEVRLQQLQETTLKTLEEEHKLKLLEYEEKFKVLNTQLENVKRTAVQGSQQTQGEALEEAIEDQLRLRFPGDSFEPVPKGVNGADLLQRVRNSTGIISGTILWEFKNTKSYSPDWTNKLANEMRTAGADIGILVSKTLPKEASPIEIIDGVFVVSLNIAIPFAATLRKSLVELSYARAVTQGQDEKMRLIYSYLTGPAFKQKILCIVQAFETIKEQLESEKKAYKRIWAAREKMLEQVIDSASSMYGEIEGIAGRVLPEMPGLKFLEIQNDLTFEEDGDRSSVDF